jgi:hypothetical protein
MKLLVLTALIMGTAAMPAQADDPAPEGMVQPAYTDEGFLVRPADFRKWVFVGASMGLNYTKNPPPGPGVFHHVYMQPEAYDHYVKTGTFPEKTMMVMENYSPGSKEDNSAKGVVEGEREFENLNGHFEDARVGFEVALKDSERFEERWGYFNFTTRGALLEAAPAFPKAACWNCHDQHAADDNVFVQFYPVLRESLEARVKSAGQDD